MTAQAIARLKIILDYVEPPVMRRIEVPVDIRLDRLHLALQAAMGWETYHLWEFRVRNLRFGPPGQDYGFGDGPLNAEKTTLQAVMEDTGAKALKYLYDFGDGWEHAIKVERISEAASGAVYPALVEAKGACPPEDVGGPPGYADYLEALADPDHERHDELIQWRGPDFDTNDPHTDRINAAFVALAKRWTRKPAVKGKKASPKA
ncbi:MAG: plasmid pRiA4b ORF-3 family protein [Hyphomonadaceae bacterium]|nr:plasmid pRiA4b ORF-3 family protein [Hyphomonadaceae bacterium]